MAGIGKTLDSLRPSRFESDRLILALAISLAAHLIVFGGYEFGKEFNLWQRLHLRQKKIASQAQPIVQNAEPEIFMEVNQPSTEAPQNAKYYSDKNSRAASKEPGDSNIPKLNGTQTDFMKVENAPRPQFSKEQPQSPSEEQVAKNETQPQSLQAGDWSRAKPQDSPDQKYNSLQPRPRTLAQARAQMQIFPGVQSRNDGGTPRVNIDPGFDVKATQFGDYDERFIEAVTQRWYDLLGSQGYALDRVGKVTLRFHLNYDGRITDMEVLENTVGELLGDYCQDAVTDPAPFEQWPSDMRRMVGANFRELTFTFYYY